MAATTLYGVGLISLVVHVNRARLVTGGWRFGILVAAVLFVSLPTIQSGWALYGEALAALAVFFPIARGMKTNGR